MEAEKAAALSKEAMNPIANLISLRVQNNTNFGAWPQGQRNQNVLNIQPVIPVPLGTDRLMVARKIILSIDQPPSAAGKEGWFGPG
jgi:hypothetical protein